ncbi:phospholipid-transporting ATPase ABCA3-like [Physella acuta]|uniref:phospholipid-transporting ATPase ABCA3-like n=1 Tax=Physella acuta TaxID=109671 RepID=UPI0027DBA7A4|nr:phospholipid-transporting ATPase ABCA3-like [Physella acuta]
MFVVFGLATIPYLYALQNFFHSPVAGITVLLIMNIIIGMVLGSINADNKLEGEKMTGFWDVVDKACSFLSPNYVLAGAMVIMLKETHFDEKLGVSVKDTPEERNKFDYLFKRDDSYMADSAYKLLFLAVASWFLVLFMDYKMYRVIGYKTKCLNVKEGLDEVKTKEDDDVIEERRRNLQTDKQSLFDTDAMLLVNVSKKYFSRPEVAVYKTCLGVKEKECLGLLGQNGAGKTTTFKMLTGDIAMSNGDAYFKGKNIKTHLRKVQSTMSYVPQFDALHDELTGRETLYLYGRLRGVREHCLSDLTEFLIDFVALRPHEYKCTVAYSGGNKRKLSVGISIIGDPQFIMLDEPTAGVDPVCRRILWNCLQVIRSLAKTLVLTSHSMEECEALCTRFAIFKKGKMLCLGSPQHLKTKFGKGFSVLLQASEKPDGTLHPLQPAVEFISEKIPGVNVFDNTPYYCHMQVSEVTPLSEIFKILVEAKTTFFLRHFLVQQKSLEQVFLLLMHQD